MAGNLPDDSSDQKPEVVSGVPVAGPTLTLQPPRIPDHEAICRIANGAYGEVWLARNVVGTLRAVKVVYRRNFSEVYPFEREFNGIQKYEPISRSHDGLIDILRIGRNDGEGYFYYVMELADRVSDADGSSEMGDRGEQTSPTSICHLQSPARDHAPRTLRHDLKLHGRLSPAEWVRISLSLSSALEHLHLNGLVHRDIKPSNIIFVKGAPKLADIGLIADVDEARSFVGTVGFIPPEGPTAARTAMMAMTTSSSIKVNADGHWLIHPVHCLGGRSPV